MDTDKRNQKAKVTSKEVASLANVSRSTVSRVLNPGSEQSMISDETAQRVREVAARLDYSPNPIARALRGERTNMIGLIVREITDPFFAGLIEIINSEARKYDFNVILGYAHSDSDEGLEMARVLDSRQMDGVIFLGDLRNDEEVLESYISKEHPIVSLCRGRKIQGLPTINCDNKLGIQMLTKHLCDLGHRVITFIDGGWFGDVLERREEFLRIKNEYPMCSQFCWIQAADDDFNGGYGVFDEIMNLNPMPTAVIGSSDTLVIGLMKAALEKGIQIPDKLSVVGFDDIAIAKYVQPSLTTIRQPIEEMAKKAIEIIIKQIERKELSNDELFIEMTPKLIIRQSTSKNIYS
jgi:LacI family repressor for deo operon, udp, cdd, tsx, nupC, and nupG